MKPFLNVLWELREIELRDSRFGFNDNAVRIDSGDTGVFVLFAVERCEILRDRS
jgi:hypothetical protein